MKPVSIVIAVAPGGSVKTVVDSLKKTKYPKSKIEVLVAEGRAPARQRNVGIEKAKNEVICFFDDDVTIRPDTIPELVEHLKDDVAIVGGPNLTPEEDSLLQKAFGEAMSSFFGAAKMSTRYKSAGEAREAGETDLILCNLAAKKKVLKAVGGFDERLYPNEENVLFNEVKKSGYKLMYNPNAVVYHSRRSSISGIAKQVFNYGRGRCEQTIIQPSSFSPMFLIPTLLLLYLILSPLLLRVSPHFIWPLGLYIIPLLISTLLIALKKRNPIMLIIMPFLYVLIHLSYGVGFIYGLKKLAPKKIKHGEIKVRKISL